MYFGRKVFHTVLFKSFGSAHVFTCFAKPITDMTNMLQTHDDFMSEWELMEKCMILKSYPSSEESS